MPKYLVLIILLGLFSNRGFAFENENQNANSNEELTAYLYQDQSDNDNTKAAPKKIEMADKLRSSGMIYIVVGVILIVLIGLLLYLYTIDKKVSKLEKSLKNE
jgi:hypothetical protein